MFTFGQTVDPFTQITDDNFANYDAVTHGDYIVYRHSNIANDNGIFLYQISTGDLTTITSGTQVQYYQIDMWGDRVVWAQVVDGEWDIYTYLISRPDLGAYALIDFDDNQYHPAIYENILVWQDERGGDFCQNIYMYDIETGIVTQVTTDDELQQFDPDVYGNYIVWTDNRNGNNDIYMYDIYHQETIQVTDDEHSQRNPSIWKKRIVWEDNRLGNWDLYMHVIGFYPDTDPVRANHPVFTGTDIGYMNEFDQQNPQVSDHYIVYQSLQNFHWDIYFYTFINPIAGTARPVVTEMRAQTDPSIWGSRVVWLDERDYTGSGWYKNDVWMWEKPAGIDLAVGIFTESDPAVLGEELDYLVMVVNLGDLTAYEPVLTFTLPPDVEFISMDGFGSEGYTREGNNLYCRLDSLTGGQTDTVTVTVRTLKDRKLTVTAEIDPVEEDVDMNNNFASYSSRVLWQVPYYVGEGGSPAVAVDGTGRPHFVYLSSPYSGRLLYATNINGAIRSVVLDSSYANHSPAIVADSHGHIHIAYSQGDEGEPVNRSLCYITNKNGAWSEPEVITANAGEGESVVIRTDRNDSLYLSFMTSLWAQGSMYYYVKEGDWDQRFVRSGTYNSSSFDLDSAAHAHFVYYDLNSYGLCYQTNSPDGTFTPETPPYTGWYGIQMETLIADMAVDRDSRPHISHVAGNVGGTTEDYKYTHRDNQGWHSETIEEGSVMGGDNSIAIDPMGRPHVSYYSNVHKRLCYAWKEEGSWNKKIVDFFSSYPPLRNHDMQVDRHGFSHIVYNKGTSVYYVTNTVPVPEPELSVEPSSLTFHEFVVGDTTDAKSVFIENTGEADLVINEIRIGWRDSASFTISGNTCALLQPGDTCSVGIRFNPTIIGSKQAMLWIDSNDPLHPVSGVELKGGGLEGILADYGFGEFGIRYLGDSSVHRHKLKNLGNTGLVVQGIFIQDGNTEDFYYEGLPEVPFGIDDGDSLMYDVIFKPTGTGERTAMLKIYSTGGDQFIELQGTGRPVGYQLQGEVRLPDQSPVTEGSICIVEQVNDGFRPVAFKPLEGTHTFSFIHVQEGDLTLKFDPDPDLYGDYVRTYYGDTPYAYEAGIFRMDRDRSGLVITLVEGAGEGEGSSSASGSLVEDDSRKSGSLIIDGSYTGNGTPLDSVPVYLTGPAGKIMHADLTDASGAFDFTQIAAGEYHFNLDYNGYPMNGENNTLAITGDNEEYSIVATVSGGSVLVSFTRLTSLRETGSGNPVLIYPNPFTANLLIDNRSERTANLSYELYDQTGRMVRHGTFENLHHGEIRRLNTSALDPGSYYLKLHTNEQSNVVHLVKCE